MTNDNQTEASNANEPSARKPIKGIRDEGRAVVQSHRAYDRDGFKGAGVTVALVLPGGDGAAVDFHVGAALALAEAILSEARRAQFALDTTRAPFGGA